MPPTGFSLSEASVRRILEIAYRTRARAPLLARQIAFGMNRFLAATVGTSDLNTNEGEVTMMIDVLAHSVPHLFKTGVPQYEISPIGVLLSSLTMLRQKISAPRGESFMEAQRESVSNYKSHKPKYVLRGWEVPEQQALAATKVATALSAPETADHLLAAIGL